MGRCSAAPAKVLENPGSLRKNGENGFYQQARAEPLSAGEHPLYVKLRKQIVVGMTRRTNITHYTFEPAMAGGKRGLRVMLPPRHSRSLFKTSQHVCRSTRLFHAPREPELPVEGAKLAPRMMLTQHTRYACQMYKCTSFSEGGSVSCRCHHHWHLLQSLPSQPKCSRPTRTLLRRNQTTLRERERDPGRLNRTDFFAATKKTTKKLHTGSGVKLASLMVPSRTACTHALVPLRDMRLPTPYPPPVQPVLMRKHCVPCFANFFWSRSAYLEDKVMRVDRGWSRWCVARMLLSTRCQITWH